MVIRFVYYVFILPVSWLPLPVIYLIAKLFLFIIHDIVGYRRDVVETNLKNSFPEKSTREIKKLSRKFYVHFGQINAEGLKGFSIQKKNLLRRFKVLNPEIMYKLYEQGKSAILVSGHFNNWEFMVQSLNLQFPQKAIGVGKPITNQGFESIMNEARCRFGMSVWDQNNVRPNIKEQIESNEPFSLMLLADQSPASYKKSYWMRFLNQDTPVIFGPEYLAHKYDLPVIYYEILKKKPGFYEVSLIPVTLNPKDEKYGDITYKHTKLLEASIKKQPENWLWSHKRWKLSHHSDEFQVRE